MKFPCQVECEWPVMCSARKQCIKSGADDPKTSGPDNCADMMHAQPSVRYVDDMSSMIRVSQTGIWRWEAYASFGAHREEFLYAFTEVRAWAKARAWVAREKEKAERRLRTTKVEKSDG